jgi:hypothetical protein
MKRLFLIFLFLLIACPAWGATYNIGPDKTYTTFAALMAAHTLAAGDIVDGGNNTFNESVVPNGSGTSWNAGGFITIQNAIIEGATPVAKSYGMDLTTTNYLKLINITFQNQTGKQAKGTQTGSNHLIFESCHFDGGGVSTYGIIASNVSGANISISNSTFVKYYNTTSSVNAAAIRIVSATGNSVLSISNTTIGGSLVNGNNFGVGIYTSNGLLLQMSHVDISYSNAPLLSSTLGATYIKDSLLADGSYINDSKFNYSQDITNGFYFSGGGNLVFNKSEFAYNGGNTTGHHGGGAGFYSNATSAMGNITLNDCLVHDNTGDGTGMLQTTNAAHGLYLNRCRIYNNGTVGDDNDGDGVTSHGNSYDIYINYCVIYDNTLTAVAMVDTSSGYIRNSTFYGNGILSPTRAQIFLNLSGTNSISAFGWNIKNTISSQGGNYEIFITDSAAGNSTFSYNNYYSYGGATSFALIGIAAKCSNQTEGISWDTWHATQEPLGSLYSDPLFISNGVNFHLQSGSPARGAGVNVGLSTTNPPDIGAEPYKQYVPWR